jgi:hypothetical protein
MKIADAKLIPLQKLVEHLGGRYSHTDRKGDMWYYSPYRPTEKTASFKVNMKFNTWHDFGLSNTFAHHMQGSGGDILDLWCDYHFKNRRTDINEALQVLEKLNFLPAIEDDFNNRPRKEKTLIQNDQPRYRILKIADSINFVGLKDELARRKISLKLANLYLKQGYIEDTITGKKYNGFLFENDKGGFELSIPNPKRNECFKTCIGVKATSRIMANDEENSANVFEGFWDFLTWLEFKGMLRPINHSYVLNSTSLVSEACDKIVAFKETVRYVFLFMDNDTAGYQATQNISEILEGKNISVGSLARFYRGYKDLNDFWIKKRTLQI